MGDLLMPYDEANRPMPSGSGVEVLRYVMQEHCLSQSDFPEIGTQSVLSEILDGKRNSMSARFECSPSVLVCRWMCFLSWHREHA